MVHLKYSNHKFVFYKDFYLKVSTFQSFQKFIQEPQVTYNTVLVEGFAKVLYLEAAKILSHKKSLGPNAQLVTMGQSWKNENYN